MIETKAVAPSTRAGGRWSNFSISGKLMSTCGRPCALALVQQLGQAVQGLRAEDHVDIGRARDDGRAFLAGHAAADADLHAAGLEVLDAAQVGEHLLLRLLAHRAGVEEDQVGLVHVGGRLVALGGVQHVGHLVRVVLVHLAAEGLDEDFAGHGILPCDAQCRSESGTPRRLARRGAAAAGSAAKRRASRHVTGRSGAAGRTASCRRRAGRCWPRRARSSGTASLPIRAWPAPPRA